MGNNPRKIFIGVAPTFHLEQAQIAADAMSRDDTVMMYEITYNVRCKVKDGFVYINAFVGDNNPVPTETVVRYLRASFYGALNGVIHLMRNEYETQSERCERKIKEILQDYGIEYDGNDHAFEVKE